MFNITKKLSNKKGTSPKNSAERNYHINPKLLEQVRNELRVNHYKRKTEEAYIGLINNILGRKDSKRENENLSKNN